MNFLLVIAAFLLLSMQMPPGIFYEHLLMEGPLSIHILEVDPSKVSIKAAHAKDQVLDLETLSSLAKRKGAFAAINGGFFRIEGPYAGSSTGILKIDGMLLSSPRSKRGAIGWSDGGKIALIDRIDLLSELHVNEEVFPIHGINQPRSDVNAILYTDNFSNFTKTDSSGTEIVIDSQKTIRSINKGGNSPIPRKGWIYSYGGSSLINFLESLKTEKAQIIFKLFPLNEPQNICQWQDMENIIGGTPVLISNNSLIADFSPEKTLDSFLEKKHPRTAVGIKPDGCWVFVIVDGRQPSFSVGMTMAELARFMQSLNCSYALNLDGGGSSALYLKDKIVNNCSGDDIDTPDMTQGTERPVSDGFLIYPMGFEE